VKVSVTKDLTKNLEKAIEALTASKVYVGIPDIKNRREDDVPIGNAAIGYLAENGSPATNLPARPWRAPGVKDAQEKISKIFKKAGQNALDGKYEEVVKGLYAAGLAAQIAMKARITAGIPPPLKQSTIARRVAQGFKGITPYIRSGNFLSSISFVVRKK
jgi:hypothetical protein